MLEGYDIVSIAFSAFISGGLNDIGIETKVLCVFVILSNLITSIMSYGVHVL